MQSHDFQQFRNTMAGMAEIFQRELSGPLLDAYWLALNDWPLADFQAASKRLMAACTFMPRPADYTALRKAARPTAGEVWPLVLNHAARGLYRSAKLDELTERAVAAVGGWQAVSRCDMDQVHWLEKRFKDQYAEQADVGETRAALPNIAPVALPFSLPNLRLAR